MYISILCPKTYIQFLYFSTKKGKSLEPGFYKYLPFWFTSGWRSSMSSCFFCNSSCTSVSFSLSSRKKSKELWSQIDLRMKTGFLPHNIRGLWARHFLILTLLTYEMGVSATYYRDCCKEVNWLAHDGWQKCAIIPPTTFAS